MNAVGLRSYPANDDIVNAAVVAGVSGSAGYTTHSASVATAEPPTALANITSSGTVWFSWTPNFAGTATVTTGSADVAIEAFTGTDYPSLAMLGSSTTPLVFMIRTAETYSIRVYPLVAGATPATPTLTWTAAVDAIAVMLPVPLLTVTPTNLLVNITGEATGEILTFRISGDVSAITSATVDATGSVQIQLPIHTLPDGTYTLLVTSNTGRAGAATFTVASTVVVLPPTPPAVPPPVTAAPITRWVLQDPVNDTTWQFPINPTSANSTLSPRIVSAKTTTAVTGGQPLLFEGGKRAQPWEFKGHLLTLADRETLEAWVAKPYRLYLTDDFGRAFVVKLLTAAMTYVRDAHNPEHHSYTVSALLYGRAS